jgi:hypothetical protein
MARRKQITSTTIIVAAGIALMVGFVIGRATSPRKGGAEPVAVAAASAGGKYVEKKLDLDPSPYKGPDDAPIVIHEISDFQ